MNVTIINPFTFINASNKVEPPYLTIGISILCGILLLILVICILYKCGFFKRAKKEAIDTFRRETVRRMTMQRMTMRIREAALLEEEDNENWSEDRFAVAENCSEMVKQLKAKQQLKNFSNEDVVEEKENVPTQPQPSTSRNRASFKTVNSITLDVNKK